MLCEITHFVFGQGVARSIESQFTFSKAFIHNRLLDPYRQPFRAGQMASGLPFSR